MADAQPFVIWVVFDIKPDAFEALHKIALEDAADSVAKEDGCLEFNVLVPDAGGNKIALFEVYKSRDAFNVHVNTPHCQKFLAAAKDAVIEKNATEWSMTQANSK